ncbi:MAG: ABC transporter permease [Anaerolineae bacterium]|nr:MAG: ABC transporter permease [Anaerolineae bacterium]
MIFKNLFRRKGRTILTMVGIAIGVAAIIALGAMAQGMRAGFGAMSRGSQADLVLTQRGSMSAVMSSVDEAVADTLRPLPEVADVDGVLFGNAIIEGADYLFFFGYDPEGFAIDHFRIVEGQGLADARGVRGKPLIMGQQAAQRMKRQVGDTIPVTGSIFRIVGIYETGDGFEDSAAVVPLKEAQALTLQPRRVSMLYVKLRDPAEADRLQARVERRFPDLTTSTTSGFADQEQLFAILEGAAAAISGLAIVIGGIVMANTLWMSVFERTREIGVLRALGWSRWRVLALILRESLALALLGGLLGIGIGIGVVFLISKSSSVLGLFGSQFSPEIFARALVTLVVLGLVGGAYPAWWASRLLPMEALQYEGGGQARASRLPGGTTLTKLLGFVGRNLWRQRTRTALTLLGIGVSIAAVITLGGVAHGMLDAFDVMMRDSQTDLFVAEADVDADFSAIDELVGARIAARPDVNAVAGMFWTGVSTEKMPMLLLYGYHPREFAIRRYRIIEGEPLMGRRHIIVGRMAAEQMGLKVGDTLRLLESNFRVVGIYETGQAFEDAGVVIGLREAQALTGKPRQVQFYLISLRDPKQAEAVRDELEAAFPEVDFSLSSELTEGVSDFQVMQELVNQISFVAVFIGAVGMLNTMLMSVLERTREIGVLRSVGWRRLRVLGMILRESLALGISGGVCGIPLGLGLGGLLGLVRIWGGAIEPLYTPQLLVQAVAVAMIAGVVGGLYPAWRATRLRPVEALRYE